MRLEASGVVRIVSACQFQLATHFGGCHTDESDSNVRWANRCADLNDKAPETQVETLYRVNTDPRMIANAFSISDCCSSTRPGSCISKPLRIARPNNHIAISVHYLPVGAIPTVQGTSDAFVHYGLVRYLAKRPNRQCRPPGTHKQ